MKSAFPFVSIFYHFYHIIFQVKSLYPCRLHMLVYIITIYYDFLVLYFLCLPIMNKYVQNDSTHYTAQDYVRSTKDHLLAAEKSCAKLHHQRLYLESIFFHALFLLSWFLKDNTTNSSYNALMHLSLRQSWHIYARLHATYWIQN